VKEKNKKCKRPKLEVNEVRGETKFNILKIIYKVEVFL
jgi:hypothetical protein